MQSLKCFWKCNQNMKSPRAEPVLAPDQQGQRTWKRPGSWKDYWGTEEPQVLPTPHPGLFPKTGLRGWASLNQEHWTRSFQAENCSASASCIILGRSILTESLPTLQLQFHPACLSGCLLIEVLVN